MDPTVATIWLIRLLFLGLLYLFLFAGRTGPRRATCARRLASPAPSSAGWSSSARRSASRAAGTTLALDAIATLGRDVNNAIVVEDQFVSAEHAILTFRGRAWYVEDLGSTNGTFVNGARSRASRRSASAT